MSNPIPEVLREGTSPAGRKVRLTRECGRYFGAAPYYHVTYRGSAKIDRSTPFLDRAERLYALLLEDVTDPAALAATVIQTPAQKRPDWGAAIGIAGSSDGPSRDPLWARENDTGFITSGTMRTRAQRGGRPQVYPSLDPAARHRAASRAYRARQRGEG